MSNEYSIPVDKDGNVTPADYYCIPIVDNFNFWKESFDSWQKLNSETERAMTLRYNIDKLKQKSSLNANEVNALSKWEDEIRDIKQQLRVIKPKFVSTAANLIINKPNET